jgi:hypothetical protein
MRGAKFLLALCLAGAAALSAHAARAACPPNAEPYRATINGNEKTVHCRCVTGFENRNGACVKTSGQGITVEPGLKDAYAAPRQSPCIVPPANEPLVKKSDGYLYMYFGLKKGCLDKPISVFYGIWTGKSCVRRETPNPATAKQPAEAQLALATDNLIGLTFTWSTDSHPCAPDLRRLRPPPKPIP